jgi:hypothetical protein
MTFPCPECGTYNRLTAQGLHCGMCERSYLPSRLQRWKARQELEARQWREACTPANAWGAALVVLLTLGLLVGMFAPFPSDSPISTWSFWLFPVWCMALVTGAILIYRFDKVEAFGHLRRTVAVVLTILALPFLYQSLPVGKARPQVERPAVSGQLITGRK